MMTKILCLAVVTAALSGTASAAPRFEHRDFFDHNDRHEQRGGGTPQPAPVSTQAAPEIDPASAMSALTMLASGLVVLRGRRIKK
jgi:hypothetical protein